MAGILKKNEQNPLGLLDKLTFGEHCGSLVGTVIETDPEYMDWLINNTNWRLDDQALGYLFDAMDSLNDDYSNFVWDQEF
jgi:hypothetical protein